MKTSHEDLARALGRVEGKLDQLIDQIVPEQQEQDRRIRSLEKERWTRYGREGFIVAVLGWIGWPAISKWLGL